MDGINKSEPRKYCDVIVIGAGASGLTAAIAAARSGASVLVLNHNSEPGKKILSTGNGKCNFTNEVQTPECYRSDDPELVAEALGRFSRMESIAFFEELGVFSMQKNGYYYPLSGQARTVRDALRAEAEHLLAEIINDIIITDITFECGNFYIRTQYGMFEARRCILATGGRSAPKTGSDGSGYAYAVGLGHSLIEPLPALVPLLSDEVWLKETTGVRCGGRVTLYVDGRETASDRGEIQFGDDDISGIPVFQVSRFASTALAERRRVEAVIDFFPDRTGEELTGILSKCAERLGSYKNWQQILGGLCNQKIAAMLCRKLNLGSVPAEQIPREKIRKQAARIAGELKHTVVPICGTGYVEHAQTTCGGIPLAEIGPDMQSKIVPGLYFAGEIMNVDGICGGYNLQWAWTSGYLAGLNAAE